MRLYAHARGATLVYGVYSVYIVALYLYAIYIYNVYVKRLFRLLVLFVMVLYLVGASSWFGIVFVYIIVVFERS